MLKKLPMLENSNKKGSSRFRKHDPEISTHCYPDAQTDREAVMQGELERTKKQMTDSLSRTRPDTDRQTNQK